MQLKRSPFLSLVASLLLAGALTACGSKKAPETPAAPPAPAVADVTTPEPTPEEPPPTVAQGPLWLAWRYAEDAVIETALLDPKKPDNPVIARKKEVAFATFGDRAYQLTQDWTAVPVKPCDTIGEALFMRLGLIGVEPAKALQVIDFADASRRPKADENREHLEELWYLGQAGPFIWVQHTMHTDACPIPGAGAEYVTLRAVDLRDGRSAELTALYGADDLEALKKDAFEAGWKSIHESSPDAPEAEVRAALKLGDIACAWGDDATLACKADVYATHKAFIDPDAGAEGEGGASATVPVPVPGRLAEYADEKAPPVVMAFWEGGRERGRGFQAVSGAAAEAVRLALVAGDGESPGEVAP